MSEVLNTMPLKSVEVKAGEYTAWVHQYDDRHNLTGGIWVSPIRVYRNGKGRHSIEFMLSGKLRQADNHPGASSFDLYKRVQ